MWLIYAAPNRESAASFELVVDRGSGQLAQVSVAGFFRYELTSDTSPIDAVEQLQSTNHGGCALVRRRTKSHAVFGCERDGAGDTRDFPSGRIARSWCPWIVDPGASVANSIVIRI